MFCLPWSIILNSEDDVEEGGIKINKKQKNVHENGNFLGRRLEKK
jgi:phage terminase small subunit